MNLKIKAALLAAAVALAGLAGVDRSSAQAQAPNVTVSWLPLGKIAAGVSVTTSSAATALPTTGGSTLYIFNSGSQDAFVAVGGSSVTASATAGGSTLIKAGTCANVSRLNASGQVQAYIAAITASSTTTLAVESGIGSASCSGGSGGGGGGGGGLSVQDQASWTQGTSNFTPGGGVFNDSATLTSGQQGTFRMTTKRAQIMDVDTSGNALYSAITSGVGTPGSAVPPTGVYIGGNVAGNFRGWTGVNPTGSVYAQQVDLASYAGAPVSVTNPVFAALAPTTSGGLSNYNIQPAASDNHAVIKAGAGQVYKIEAFNNSATVNYVRLYNATTGFNGCNSATNLVWQGIIPASTSGAGLSASWMPGIAFATGISICVTSGYAQNDTTNATASALIVNVGYK